MVKKKTVRKRLRQNGRIAARRPRKNQAPPTTSCPSNPDVRQCQREFPIVGIGASAGGLDALKNLLDTMPAEPGVALVVIQHLDPTKASLAAELLARHTSMLVTQVNADVSIAANCVYVIPPNKNLSVSGGVLRLSKPEQPRGLRVPIDFFLRSLAQDQQQRAVGVILSGTGADGTLGVKAIKAAGGLVLAQAPETAEHPGMPRSAITSGAVDHVVPVSEMSDILRRYAEHPYVRESVEERPPAEQAAPEEPLSDEDCPENLNKILTQLRTQAKHDFHGYRRATLVRRIRRRMCLLHIDDYDQYVDYLCNHRPEIDSLVKDLLISVTDFFRDLEAWQELKEQVIVPLVDRKQGDEPIRVWVPGCATG